MPESDIEKIINSLHQSICDLRIRLSRNITFNVKKSPLEIYFTSNLDVRDENAYLVPLSVKGIPLKTSYDVLERVKEGGLEFIIGYEKEINEELEKRDKSKIGIEYLPVPVAENKLLNKTAKEAAKNKAIREYIKFLEEGVNNRVLQILGLSSNLTPRIKESVLMHINNAGTDDRHFINRFDKRYSSQEIDNSSEGYIKAMSRIYNIFSFGGFKNDLKEEVEVYAIRYIVWDVLEKTSSRVEKELEEDRSYLSKFNSKSLFSDEHSKGISEKLSMEISDEIHKKLDSLTSFYGNISIFASHGRKRMKGLLERCASLYSKFANIDFDSIKESSEQIVNKIISCKSNAILTDMLARSIRQEI